MFFSWNSAEFTFEIVEDANRVVEKVVECESRLEIHIWESL